MDPAMGILMHDPTRPGDFPPGFDAYRAARERFFDVLRRIEPEDHARDGADSANEDDGGEAPA